MDFRRYANQVKKNLIKSYTKDNSIVVDLGSGKGGDIYKYALTKLRRCYLVEPYFYRELQYRLHNLKDMRFNSIRQMAQYNNLHNLIHCKADNIFMFFSLNFFNENTLPSLINNIDYLLKNDGIVVFTYMDGERVLNMLRKCDGQYKNENYCIYNVDKSKDLELGHKIKICINAETVDMKGQYEYLIPFNDLYRCLRKLNYTLLETKFFDELEYIDSLDKKDREFISMYRYNVYKK